MALTSLNLVEEALALPLADRQQLLEMLLDSLTPDDGRSDAEVSEDLRQGLADLQSGKDPGLTFEEVFGEKF